MANRLINEQSPYLQQHAHNPVDWYPWGDEAFEKAKSENKPVLVSIGYAACHWCHVMERESFENSETAAYMNEHFINIKVDREEHPDVDHMYMDAVQAISGSGGWPLNVFVTPHKLPFYGGTYYPPRPAFNRPSWRVLLERMHEIWTGQHEEVKAQSEQMLQYLKQASATAFKAQKAIPDKDTCKSMVENLLQQADKVNGGFGRAPKFPGTMAINFLLEHYRYTGNEAALKQALLSLDSMTKGGIYDQLGGGFARYATDNEWLVPHFEKMLYDNALLILSLCDAYYITGDERYAQVVRETIAFTEGELKDNSGLYYSALDADSEGEEGKFYTWTWEEWKEVVGENDVVAGAYFGVSEKGNWEHTNILHIAVNEEQIARENGITLADLQQHIAEVRGRLFKARAPRIRPLTDDKSLLSWNALMNQALSRAGLVLKEEKYIAGAKDHMDNILAHFVVEGELLHSWKQGRAKITAKLDDHAYLQQALLQLATVSGDVSYVSTAAKWVEKTIADFGHEDGSFFYYSSVKQSDIPARKVDIYDGAVPSANAVMAHNLLVLGSCVERSEWTERGLFMMQQTCSTARHYTYSFAYWAMLIQRYVHGLKTAVCTGIGASRAARHIAEECMPHAYVLTSEKEIFDPTIFSDKFLSGALRIFVCTQEACLSPVDNIQAALQAINQ
ncbi:MAG: thioredoxin domain-containing protein [Bacteroidetes bacterium]|nr:thioredoxin domain-containing protein [Bacteroidota bacterium]